MEPDRSSDRGHAALSVSEERATRSSEPPPPRLPLAGTPERAETGRWPAPLSRYGAPARGWFGILCWVEPLLQLKVAGIVNVFFRARLFRPGAARRLACRARAARVATGRAVARREAAKPGREVTHRLADMPHELTRHSSIRLPFFLYTLTRVY